MTREKFNNIKIGKRDLVYCTDTNIGEILSVDFILYSLDAYFPKLNDHFTVHVSEIEKIEPR